MKYIKKPVEIEAIQFTRNNWDEVKSFTNNKAHTLSIEKRINGIATFIIPTLEGHYTATEGDWIIKGVKGKFYICKPDFFKMTYEPVMQKGNKMSNEIKIQILLRNCCNTIFAGCVEPYCYTDEDWLNSLKDYVNNGCVVEYVEAGKGLQFEKCKCNEIQGGNK